MDPPTSPDQMITALSLALSPDPASRSESLSALQAWSTLPGYYSYLTKIFTEPGQGQVADQVRLQALLQFKNGVDKYWRRTATNAISPQEKAAIRPQLLSMINEPNRVIAKNLAVTIGKLARLDYGIDWNELPQTLLASLESSTSLLTLHRSLLYLHATIKSLSSNRAPKGRLLMKKLTEMLFSPLVNIHGSILTRAVQGLQRDGLRLGVGEQVQVEEEIECALLAFKSLRFLTIYGDSNPALNEPIKAFFASTLPTLTSLVSLRLELLNSPSPSTRPTRPESPRLTFLTKHVISYLKLYRGLINHNVQMFDQMGITQGILELVWQLIKNASTYTRPPRSLRRVDPAPVQEQGATGEQLQEKEEEEEDEDFSNSFSNPFPNQIVIPSLLLLKLTLSSWSGQTPFHSQIPISFILELSQLLTLNFLVLSKPELERWESEPEEFVNEEELDQWEFELRPCAEYVLRSLVGGYREELGSQLSGFLNDPNISNPQDLKGLLLKEAVYTAVGKSAADLTQSINFEDWLNRQLVQEVASIDPNYRIIRRRIAWLLGSLISEDLAAQSRPLIYSLIVHLLSRSSTATKTTTTLGGGGSNDQAIRLTAARSLQKCDTWDFDLEGFLPFLGKAIEELVALLGEVETSDTLMKLNQTLAVVIARVGQHIGPFAPRLSEVLGTLWNGAQENQPHFQTSILVTMTRLAEALGESSQALHAQAGPIIQLGVDSSRPSHVYLQEDALELWQVLLRRSSTLTPEMLSLLPSLVVLLGQGTDVLPRCLSIFESYLLLDAARVMELCHSSFFASISNLLDGLRFEAVKVVLHSMNTIFKTAPPATWAASLDESGCFQTMLQVVSQPDTSALISTKYLCSIARIVLSSRETFDRLLGSTSARTNTSSDHLLSIILNQFIERLDNMSQGGQRKIVALALGELVVTTNPIVLSRLGELVALWSGVLAQTEETREGDAELYHVPDDYTSDIDPDYTETLETERKSTLSLIDPMITNKLSTFIGEKLSQAQTINGGSEAFQVQWLNRVDPIVVEELVQRLEGKLKG